MARNKRRMVGYKKSYTGNIEIYKLKVVCYHVITKRRVVLTCFVKEEIFGNLYTPHSLQGKAHIASPCISRYYVPHESHAPAYFIYDKDDNLLMEKWFSDGQERNPEGPSNINYHQGKVFSEDFKFNDTLMTKEFSPNGELKAIQSRIYDASKTIGSYKNIEKTRHFRKDNSLIEEYNSTTLSIDSNAIVNTEKIIINNSRRKIDKIIHKRDIKFTLVDPTYQVEYRKFFYKNDLLIKTLFFIVLHSKSNNQIISRTKYTEEEWENYLLMSLTTELSSWFFLRWHGSCY